ncbi:hypothetical protein [Burkholderia sp. PU8-34]
MIDPRVRFFGNVEIGADNSHAELAAWYDAIVHAVDGSSDTRTDMPGETLLGRWAAREVVGLYNGNPDYWHLGCGLFSERVVICGNGNSRWTSHAC